MFPPRWISITGAALVVLLISGMATTRWRPAQQIERKQATFFQAVADRKSKRIASLLAEDYRDSWGLDKINALRACDDLKQHFLTLEFRQLDPALQVEGTSGVLTTRVQIVGNPIGPGAYIKQKANRLQIPFEFTWERQNLFPWSWRMTSMGNAGLPSLEGYDPSTGFDVIPGL